MINVRRVLVVGLVWSSAVAHAALAPAVVVLGAKLSDAEKAKQKAEKKLEAFAKEYDPAKKLANKGAELEKDIADLDKELAGLRAVDAAAAGELEGRRDAAVAAARQAVGGAQAGKAADDLEKKLERAAKDFDPAKKTIANTDPKQLERARKELDELISRLEPSARGPYEAKRDAIFQGVEKAMEDAKVSRLRLTVPEAATVPAAAGAETIAPMKPTWCEGVVESLGDKLKNTMAGIPDRFEEQLTAGILFSCIDPDFEPRQKAVAAYRQKMSNALGLTAAMNERLMKLGAKLFLLGDDKAQRQSLCESQLAPRKEGTAAVRANRALERIAAGCGNRASDENRMRLIDVDAPGALDSQLAAAGLVGLVLTQNVGDGNDRWKLTQASDVAVLSTLALEPATFERQLEALALNELGQAKAILAFFRARARLAGFAAAYRELANRVPGLQKLVFDAPAAGAKRYLASQAAADKPVLDLVLAMEAQPGALKGCARQLWPHLEKELGAQPKSKLSEVRLSGLLAFALTYCGNRDSEVPGLAPVAAHFSERTTAVRGPLTAAYLATLEAYNEVAGSAGRAGFDPGRTSGRSDEALVLPQPKRNPLGEAEVGESLLGHANTMDPSGLNQSGVVKAVERSGEVAKLVFRTESYVVPDYKCVETGKIDRILPDGQILYRSDCTKIGEHQETATKAPVEIPAWTAGGIAPGSLVVLYQLADNSSGAGRAWVLEAFDSKARARRTNLLGVTP